MLFTNIKDLKYSKADKSTIDLLCTCKEYGEIPMTLNIIDTEDNHHFATGKFKTTLEKQMVLEKKIIIEDEVEKEVEELVEIDVEVKTEILIPLEEYCKTLTISPYVGPAIEVYRTIKLLELKNITNYEEPIVYLDVSWVGGPESAQLLNNKRQLAIDLELSTLTFTDATGIEHELSLDEAKNIFIAIASEYEKRRTTYKSRKLKIEACKTVDELKILIKEYGLTAI